MIKSLLLVLTLSAQGGPPDWLRADTVVSSPGRPTLALIRREGDPLVALRWFVPVQEAPEQAGAGQVVAILSDRRARSYADRLGATFSVRRTDRGIAYSVSGSRLDLDHLFDVLRVAMARPESDPVLLRRAASTALAEIERGLESAERNLASRLTESVCPGTPPRNGTRDSLIGLDADGLGAVWEAGRRVPEETTLVIAGDLSLEVILSALPALDGAASASAPSGRTYAGGPDPERPGRTQVLRQWYGEARSAGPASDPRGAVAARLLGREVAGAGDDLGLSLELVDAGCTTALLVMGGAYRQNAVRLRRTVEGFIAAARAGITESGIAAVVLDLERIWMRRGATPVGIAEIVGRSLEEGAGPDGARRYLSALSALDRAAMIGYLDRLLATPPIRAELGS